jgi:hypothetical protein
MMRWFITILVLISTLIAGKLKEPIIVSYAQPEPTIGRYQIFVTEVTSVKTGQQYLVETIFDTRSGKIVSRTKFLFYKQFNEVVIETDNKNKKKDVFETIGIPVKGVCK